MIILTKFIIFYFSCLSSNESIYDNAKYNASREKDETYTLEDGGSDLTSHGRWAISLVPWRWGNNRVWSYFTLVRVLPLFTHLLTMGRRANSKKPTQRQGTLIIKGSSTRSLKQKQPKPVAHHSHTLWTTSSSSFLRFYFTPHRLHHQPR